MTRTLRLAACFIAATTSSFAQVTSDLSKPTFTVFHEMGRVEEASFDNTLPIENQWVHRSGAWVGLHGQRGERLSLDLVFGGVYYTNTKEQSDANTKTRFFAASVPRFDVTYLIGQDPQDPFLKLNAGIFNYKYNEYSKNLGEYAFRTGTYPGWISTGGITYVGVNSAQVTGFRLSQGFGAFTHELLATLETEVIPTYDLSLTYMAKYNWNNVVKLGGGVQLARLLPAVPSRTNPSRIPDANFPDGYNPNTSNRYFKHNGEWYVDSRDYYDALLASPSISGADSARYQNAKRVIDSAQGHDVGLNPVPQISVDYKSYKASGVKPLATFAFDPKPLVGGIPMLGSSDLVLYGEAALLGVKDYPVFYDDWTKRLPVMVGFNLPTFKLLDVLAFEVEYYGSEYPDNFQGVISGNFQGVPWPTVPAGTGGYNAADWKDDNWKWSVYTQRRIVDGVTLSAQVARDHARAWAYPTGKTYWGIINDDNDWYWMLKLTANL
ncbi:MAG: hypothetical protein K0Q91_2291 [Fibrobacteria bacterium]|jgi:hypothetical protein|nr:hypothetical protein [Fibrobacteria bacterium]